MEYITKTKAASLTRKARALLDAGDERGYDLVASLVDDHAAHSTLDYASLDAYAQAEFEMPSRVLLYRVRAGRVRAALRAAGVTVPKRSGLTLGNWAALKPSDADAIAHAIAGGGTFTEAARSVIGMEARPLGSGLDLLPADTDALLPAVELLLTAVMAVAEIDRTALARDEDALLIALSALTAIVEHL